MAHIAIVHVPDGPHPDGISVRLENDLPEGYRLVGIFIYPARRDATDHPNCSINGKGAWSRDRMGFMKCASCGKRNKRIRQFLINALFDFLGSNLYPKAPAAFRTPDGYGNPPRRTYPD